MEATLRSSNEQARRLAISRGMSYLATQASSLPDDEQKSLREKIAQRWFTHVRDATKSVDGEDDAAALKRLNDAKESLKLMIKEFPDDRRSKPLQDDLEANIDAIEGGNKIHKLLKLREHNGITGSFRRSSKLWHRQKKPPLKPAKNSSMVPRSTHFRASPCWRRAISPSRSPQL